MPPSRYPPDLIAWIEQEMKQPFLPHLLRIMESDAKERIRSIINSPEEKTYERGRVAGVEWCASLPVEIVNYGQKKEQDNVT